MEKDGKKLSTLLIINNKLLITQQLKRCKTINYNILTISTIWFCNKNACASKRYSWINYGKKWKLLA